MRRRNLGTMRRGRGLGASSEGSVASEGGVSFLAGADSVAVASMEEEGIGGGPGGGCGAAAGVFVRGFRGASPSGSLGGIPGARDGFLAAPLSIFCSNSLMFMGFFFASADFFAAVGLPAGFGGDIIFSICASSSSPGRRGKRINGFVTSSKQPQPA